MTISFSAYYEHDFIHHFAAIEADPQVDVTTAASVCHDTFQGEIFCWDDIPVDLQPCFSGTVKIHVGGNITVHANYNGVITRTNR